MLIRNLQYLKHLRSDSGADRTYHARDTAGRARTVTGSTNVWARPIFRIRFRPLDRRDAISWVEMDCRQKEWFKYVSMEQCLSYVALEVVYTIRPVKLDRVSTRVLAYDRLLAASCYCQSKCRTRRMSYWLLAKTSLDPMEY